MNRKPWKRGWLLLWLAAGVSWNAPIVSAEEAGLAADQLPAADPATLPEVPVIRPGLAREMTLDGRLDEAAWRETPGYSEFGLDSGEGPTDFPTTARFLLAGRELWIGLECDLPRPADHGEVATVLGREILELFLDNSWSRRMSYHLGLTPAGGVSIPGVATSDVPARCRAAVSRRDRGYTLEVRLMLDAFDKLGPPNRERIGINLARDSVKRWASLNGGTGQGQKPEQFWTLLLGTGGVERAPQAAYRPLYREGTDVAGLATNYLAAWEAWKRVDFPGRALMDVRMQRLAVTLEKSRKDRWGAPVPLRAALFRGWRAQRDLLPEASTSAVARAVEAALMPGVAEGFPDAAPRPASGWRECAVVVSDDGTAQPYALYVPAGSSGGRRLPLVVYLHGSGMGSFSDGLIFERHQPPIDFMMARINARRCGRYHEVEKREIGEVIDDIAAHWPLDTNRVSILGFSAGAFAAAELAVEQPDRFSAIAAVAGRFLPLRAGLAPAIPVVAAWGMADPVVPYQPAEAAALVELVRKRGGKAIVFALPDTDHAVPMSGLEYWLAAQFRAAGAR